MSRACRRATALAPVLVVLAACAPVPRTAEPGPEAVPAEARAAALAAFDGWTASGRVAVRTPAEGFGASFEWREAGGTGELAVRGPFGAGAARIVRGPERIVVETGDGPPLEIPAPFDALDAALGTRLGFGLPVAQLRWWLVGVPAPEAPSRPVPAGFEQAGWTVRGSGHAAVPGAPAELPRRVELEREGTRIRVVIDRWAVATRADAP